MIAKEKRYKILSILQPRTYSVTSESGMSTTSESINRTPSARHRFRECLNEQIKAERLRVHDKGYVGQCFISSIEHEEKRLCYILDADHMPNLSTFFSHGMKPLPELPRPGQMFAYNLGKNLLVRAVRCDSNINTSTLQFSIFLVDIGCTIWLNTNRGCENMYDIDKLIKQIPSFAMKCQVVHMSDELNLLNLLHSRVHYQIVNKSNDLYFINLLAKDKNPFRNSDEVGSEKEFYSYFQWNALNNIDCKSSPSSLPLTEFNRFETESAPQKDRFKPPRRPHTQNAQQFPQASNKHTKNDPFELTDVVDSFNNIVKTDRQRNPHFPVQLSEKDTQALEYFRKTLNSSTAYTSSEKKILNPSVKSDSSNEESSWSVTDVSKAWSTHEDRMEEFVQSLSNDDSYERLPNVTTDSKAVQNERFVPRMQLPKINETIEIVPTFVIDVDQFYAAINSSDSTAITSNQLCVMMNKEKELANYVRFSSPPAIREFVFAIYQNKIYRARITARYDEEYYQVLYIDYGNCAKVLLRDMYKWDSRWNHVPVLAYHFSLNRVQKIRVGCDYRAIHAVKNMLLEHRMRARIVDIANSPNDLMSLVVDLMDENDIDVVELLSRKHYIKLKTDG